MAETDAAPLEVGVLGTFQARIRGQWVPAPTRQVARVGTVLAGWPGESVDRDRIIFAVWGEDPPNTATNTLQVHISHLRRLIGKEAVRATQTGYLLDLPPESTDAGQFVDGLSDGSHRRRSRHYRRAVEHLTDAMTLWRGVPYVGVLDPDLLARRVRFVEFAEQAREDLLACRLELATDHHAMADVIAEAKELVSRQPHRERGHALLVRALAVADRRSEAAVAYDSAVAYLSRTRPIDPGRDLVVAHDAAMTSDVSLRPAATASITNLRGDRKAPRSTLDIVRRVRAAMVDEGAVVVSIVCDDPTTAAQACEYLPSRLGEELSGDMVTGVISLDESDATVEGLEQVLAQASGNRITRMSDLDSPDTLAVIIQAARGADTAAEIVDAVADWTHAPRILVIAPDVLDREGVVVVRAHADGSVDSPVLRDLIERVGA